MAKNNNNTQEPIEKQLWKAADKLRKNIDAAEYKHIVLGLIFLKYISDSFKELHEKLTNGQGNEEMKSKKLVSYLKEMNIKHPFEKFLNHISLNFNAEEWVKKIMTK